MIPFPLSNTTRLYNGLVNSRETEDSGGLTIFDQTKHHVFSDDFDSYIAARYKILSSATTTTTVVGGDGGFLSIVPQGANANSSIYAADGLGNILASFVPTKDGKYTFFKTLFSLSDALNSIFTAGLVAANSTFTTITDGIYLHKLAGVQTLSLVIVKGGVSTTIPLNGSLVSGAPSEVSFGYDGSVTLFACVNGVITLISTFNYNESIISQFLPIVSLTPNLGLQNNASNITLLIDDLFVDRVRYLDSGL